MVIILKSIKRKIINPKSNAVLCERTGLRKFAGIKFWPRPQSFFIRRVKIIPKISPPPAAKKYAVSGVGGQLHDGTNGGSEAKGRPSVFWGGGVDCGLAAGVEVFSSSAFGP